MLMKQRNFMHSLTLSVVLAGVFFTTSCSNDDYLSVDSETEELTFDTYIGLDDVKAGPYTAYEMDLFREAAGRYSSRLEFEQDNTVSLMEGTTAGYLNISENLFELFNGVIGYWNEHPATFIDRRNSLVGFSTATRGGNILCDIAASEIYSITAIMGWKLTAKLFRLWYFDNRSSEYTLTDREWQPVASSANSIVGQNYRNNPFMVSESTYYQNSVSFYGASSDLKFALGSCTINFDADGYAVGLSDFYDFDAGNRGTVNETLMSIIRWIGDDGGFAVKYGIVKPAQD